MSDSLYIYFFFGWRWRGGAFEHNRLVSKTRLWSYCTCLLVVGWLNIIQCTCNILFCWPWHYTICCTNIHCFLWCLEIAIYFSRFQFVIFYFALIQSLCGVFIYLGNTSDLRIVNITIDFFNFLKIFPLTYLKTNSINQIMYHCIYF